MPARPDFFPRYRFPASIIRLAVWLYYRFPLSHRDVETMLFERGMVVSYETVRQWTIKFGDRFGHELRMRERRPGRIWHLDEMEVDIRGHKHWLPRLGVDQEGKKR